jgi:hypothetical protein
MTSPASEIRAPNTAIEADDKRALREQRGQGDGIAIRIVQHKGRGAITGLYGA